VKRRDFIKTVGISCMGACFKPLGVLAASNASLKSYTSYTGASPQFFKHVYCWHHKP